MIKAKCMAITEHGRINLVISKGEEGYEKFVEVLKNIKENGFMSWCGDITDEAGKERSGLVLTARRDITQVKDSKNGI